MRSSFINALTALADAEPRILLLTGDLGYTVIEPFAEKYPDRFFNVGVAEQNLLGLATGLAEAGWIPFVYSIIPFLTLRAYEFIRNGPVLHGLPVRLIGVGAGFDYGTAGSTHYGLEDIAVLRTLPGLTLVTPADHEQAASALRATWQLKGPVYYRLSKEEKKTIPGLAGQFQLGKLQALKTGKDVVILALGHIAGEALRAADLLGAQGISCEVTLVSSFNSTSEELPDLLKRFRLACTVEAHYTRGGLGSWVAETIADRALQIRLIRKGVDAPMSGLSGKSDFLYDHYGLSAEKLAAAVGAAMRKS